MSSSKTLKGPPKDKADYSSNWKKFQATFEPRKRKISEVVSQNINKGKKLKESSERGKQYLKGAQFTKAAKSTKMMKLDNTEDTVNQKDSSKKTEINEIWFEDADGLFLEKTQPINSNSKNTLLLHNAVTHATKALAIDCEMVGVGKAGVENALARVSIVNQHGYCIYDKFVRPREKVTDFRTHVSGVRPVNLKDAEEFLVVQKEVSDLLKDKILVGHALHNDLQVLFLDHPRKKIRDTSLYKPFRQLSGGKRPALKKLSAKLLGVTVQHGEHNSVEDAQAAMQLYMMHRRQWENQLKRQRTGKKPTGRKKKKPTLKTVKIANGS